MIDDLLRPTGPGPRPPVDGFAVALRGARRRRLRTLRTNAATALTAAAAVVAAVVPRMAAPGPTGLVPTRPGVPTYGTAQPWPGSSPAPSPTPSPAGPARDGTHGVVEGDGRPGTGGYAAGGGPGGPGPAGYGAPASHGPGTPGHPGGPARPGASEAPGGGAPGSRAPDEPDPEPTTAPEPTYGPTQPAPTEEPTQPPPTPEPSPSPTPEPVDQGTEGSSALCDTATWCTSMHATPRGDGSVTFKLRACRPASDSVGRLRFQMENEADFRVLRNGTELWRWSAGEPDDTYVHDVYVDHWECATWTTRWWSADRTGARVPAGDYRVEGWSHATNLPDRWWGTTVTVP